MFDFLKRKNKEKPKRLPLSITETYSVKACFELGWKEHAEHGRCSIYTTGLFDRDAPHQLIHRLEVSHDGIYYVWLANNRDVCYGTLNWNTPLIVIYKPSDMQPYSAISAPPVPPPDRPSRETY